MRLILTTSLVFAFLGVQSCANNSDSTANPKAEAPPELTQDQNQDSGWKQVQDPLYTMEYPANWEANYTGQFGISMVAVSPVEDANDKFRENVTLVIQDLKGEDIDLETFVDQNSGKVRATVNDSKLVEDKDGGSGEDTYREIQYTGSQSDYTLVYTQRFYIHKGYAFVFSFTCQQAKYDEFSPTGIKILDSIDLK